MKAGVGSDDGESEGAAGSVMTLSGGEAGSGRSIGLVVDGADDG